MGKLTIRKSLGCILGFVFLIASISKFIDPYPFADFINSFRLLAGDVILPIAYVLAFIELVLSLFLIFDYHSTIVAWLFLAVITIVTVYSIWLFFTGISLDCGCFGGFLDREIGVIYFLTNGLIIMGFVVFLWLDKKISPQTS